MAHTLCSRALLVWLAGADLAALETGCLVAFSPDNILTVMASVVQSPTMEQMASFGNEGNMPESRGVPQEARQEDHAKARMMTKSRQQNAASRKSSTNSKVSILRSSSRKEKTNNIHLCG